MTPSEYYESRYESMSLPVVCGRGRAQLQPRPGLAAVRHVPRAAAAPTLGRLPDLGHGAGRGGAQGGGGGSCLHRLAVVNVPTVSFSKVVLSQGAVY